MFLFYLFAFFVVLSSNTSYALTCSNPMTYTTSTSYACSTSTNYIAGSSLTGFPSSTTALTVIALFQLSSTTATSCAISIYPVSLFTLTLNSGGTDITILELVRTSLTVFKYSLMGNQYAGQDIGGTTTGVFSAGDWIEMKASVDLSNNKANMATTYLHDDNFDAALPSSVSLSSYGYAFDGNTKFWFGGGPSATKRYQITLAELTVWDGYLPVVSLGTTTYYPGEILLGHSPTLIANYKMQEYSGTSLADSTGISGVAYLGSNGVTTYAPSWVSDEPVLSFTSSQYITLPAFTVSAPNSLVMASLSVSFWIKLTSSPSGSNSYIFRYSNAALSTDRFALRINSDFSLRMCAGSSSASSSCQDAFTSGLSLNTWTLLTVNWAFRTASSALNCYYSVYSNGQLLEAKYIATLSSSLTTYAPTTDLVRFGGFIGQLGAIQIYSPGSLQSNYGTWCTSTTCAADLGALNPPTCLLPSSCDVSCSTCSDSTAKGCLVCASGYYFSGGSCASCPTGTFYSGSSCDGCPSYCDVCSSSTTCTTCSAKYIVSGSGSCDPCPSYCEVCSSSSVCTTCETSYFLNSGSCVSGCPVTTYTSGTNCYDCPSDCDYCSDGSTCTTCSSTYYLYQDQCYNPCPTTTYASGADCLSCPSNCATCSSDGSDCLTCNTHYYLYGTECVASCPTTTFISGSDCASCPGNCDECSDGSTCNTCSSSYHLYQDQCYNPCPTSTYISGTDCLDCPSNCDECSDGSTCTTCSSSYYLYQDLCYNPCPTTTYASSTTECSDCPSHCDSCTDGSTCTDCSSGYYLYQDLCYNPCPTTTYASGEDCLACPSHCDSCSSDGVTCLVCSSGYYLYQGQCYDPCPATTFESGTNCVDCISYCYTCIDGSTCSLCNTNYYLYQQTCYGICPVKTFTAGTNCEDCGNNCDTCSDQNTCTVCSSGYYLYHSQCYGTCPITTYTSGTDCLDCSSYCDVCVDSNTCTTCTSGYYFYQSKCYVKCPYQAPYTSPTVSPYTCYKTCPTLTPYKYKNQCYTKCPSEAPYVSDYVCSDSNPDSAEEIAKIGNVAGSTASTVLISRSISSFSNPSPCMFGSLMKLLQYTRYQNVSHSDRLEVLFQTITDSGDYIPMPTMSNDMQNAFENHPLPYVFAKYDLNSNFMLNEGDDILGILTILALFVLCWVMQRSVFYLRNVPTMRSLIVKSRFFFQNYLISEFYEMLGDVAFASVLEVKTLDLDNQYARLSFSACLVCLFLGGILYALNIWIVYAYQKRKAAKRHHGEESEKHKKKLEEFSEKYEGIEILFNDFEDRSFIHQAALIFFVGRNIIFCTIVALFYSIPLFQATLLLVLDLCLVIYYFWKRSIKSRMDFIEQLTYELILLAVNICFFVQAMADSAGGSSASLIYNIGEVVIVLNTICKFLPFVFLGLRLGLSLWEYFKLLRLALKSEMKKKEKEKLRKENQKKKISKQSTNSSSDSSLVGSYQGSYKLNQVRKTSLNEGSHALNIDTSKIVDHNHNASVTQLNVFRNRKISKMSSIVPLRFSQDGLMSESHRVDLSGVGGSYLPSFRGQLGEGIAIVEGTEVAEVAKKRKIRKIKKRRESSGDDFL